MTTKTPREIWIECADRAGLGPECGGYYNDDEDMFIEAYAKALEAKQRQIDVLKTACANLIGHALAKSQFPHKESLELETAIKEAKQAIVQAQRIEDGEK